MAKPSKKYGASLHNLGAPTPRRTTQSKKRQRPVAWNNNPDRMDVDFAAGFDETAIQFDSLSAALGSDTSLANDATRALTRFGSAVRQSVSSFEHVYQQLRELCRQFPPVHFSTGRMAQSEPASPAEHARGLEAGQLRRGVIASGRRHGRNHVLNVDYVSYVRQAMISEEMMDRMFTYVRNDTEGDQVSSGPGQRRDGAVSADFDALEQRYFAARERVAQSEQAAPTPDPQQELIEGLMSELFSYLNTAVPLQLTASMMNDIRQRVTHVVRSRMSASPAISGARPDPVGRQSMSVSRGRNSSLPFWSEPDQEQTLRILDSARNLLGFATVSLDGLGNHRREAARSAQQRQFPKKGKSSFPHPDAGKEVKASGRIKRSVAGSTVRMIRNPDGTVRAAAERQDHEHQQEPDPSDAYSLRNLANRTKPTT